MKQMKKCPLVLLIYSIFILLSSRAQLKHSELKSDTSSWVYWIDREGQKWCTYDNDYMNGKWWLQSDYGPGWGALQNDIWSSDKQEYLPNISKYILWPTNPDIWREQYLVMDDNQFSIPIWTNTFIDLSQVWWYKVTKLGTSFDGIKVDTNITSNVTFDIFKQEEYGKFTHIDSDRVVLDLNQSLYILIKSSQWYQGKVDMIKLVSYNQSDWRLNTGYKILIVQSILFIIEMY